MDNSRRELERSIDVSNESALLWARLRVGEISRQQLELGAYCGDPRCVELTGGQPTLRLPPWIRGFGRWGKDAVVRTTLAFARDAVARAGGEFALADEALRIAGEWLQEPLEERERSAAEVAEAIEQALLVGYTRDGVLTEQDQGWSLEQQAALKVAFRLALGVAASPGDRTPPRYATRSAVTKASRHAARAATVYTAYLGSELTLRKTVRAMLVPWALGEDS